MKKLNLLGIIILTALTCGDCHAQIDFWGDLKTGEFKTGYQRIFAIDDSRPNVQSSEPIKRPIIINLWYPTDKSPEQAPMKHSEYLNFSSELLGDDLEKKFYDYNLEMIRAYSFDAFIRTSKWKRKRLSKQILENTTHAYKDADFPSQKFPLLIFHQGLGASIEDNAAMIEWLCSNGYVVVNAAYQSENKDYMSVNWDLDRSINDIDYMVNYLSQYPFIDTSRIGIMGQSYGGQASLAYAVLGEHKISGVITFDSTMDYTASYKNNGFKPLFDPLLQNALDFNMPLLAFADEDAIFTITDSLTHSPRVYAKVSGMSHEDYITQGAAGALIESDHIPKKHSTFYKQRFYNYLQVCRNTLDFWNRVFNETDEFTMPSWSSIDNEKDEPQFAYEYREIGENSWREKYASPGNPEDLVLDGEFTNGKKNYTFKKADEIIQIIFKNGSKSIVSIFNSVDNDQVVIYIDRYSIWGTCEVSEKGVIEKIIFDNWGSEGKTMVRVN